MKINTKPLTKRILVIAAILTTLGLGVILYTQRDNLKEAIETSSPPEIENALGVENKSNDQNEDLDDSKVDENNTKDVEDNITVAESKKIIEPSQKDSTNFTAGNLTSLTIDQLSANTLHILNLKGYEFDNLAICWPEGKIYYDISSNQTDYKLTELIPSDDRMEFEKNFVSELIYPEHKEYIFLKSDRNIQNVKIDLISPASSTELASSRSISATNQYNRDSGAKYTSLTVISRDQWGANTSSWDPNDSSNIDDPDRFRWEPTYHPISRIVVHHTAGANNPSDPAATVRSIYIYHAYTRKWGDIGYNFLIDHKGNIYEGKGGGDEVYSYHAYTEANAMSVSISLMGNFTSVYPTSSAQSSLVKLMAEKSAFYGFGLRYSSGSLSRWLNSGYTVFGHRDTWFWCYPGHPDDHRCTSGEQWIQNATACPGNYTEALLPSIVSRAIDYRNSHFSTIKSVVNEANEQISQPHEADQMYVVFDRPFTVSESEILSLIPAHSSISNVEIDGNIAKITVGDWNNGGMMPPAGWDGYNHPGTFFPAVTGTDDRLKTLLKIFMLDNDAIGAELILSNRELY